MNDTFPDGVFWPRFSGLTHQCHYGRNVAIQFGADWGNGPKREKPLTWRGKWRTEEGSNAKCCRGIWLLLITTKFIKVLVQAHLNSELILGYTLLRSVHRSRFWGFQRPCMNSLAWLGSRAGHWQSESFDWRIDPSSFAVHLFAPFLDVYRLHWLTCFQLRFRSWKMRTLLAQSTQRTVWTVTISYRFVSFRCCDHFFIHLSLWYIPVI